MKRNNAIHGGLIALKSCSSFNDIKKIGQKILNGTLGTNINFQYYTKVPQVLQIEPTNQCNLKCISCPWSECSREKGYMNFNLFKKIINEAANTGVELIQLFCLGEPLLHPQLAEMISYIKSKNLPVCIATNGMLLNNKICKEILRSGVTKEDLLRVSVLGYSKEIHEKIMKGANHEKIIDNIFNFLEFREKFRINGPIVETVFWTMPENEHEKKEFKKYWQGIVDYATVWGSSESFRDLKKQEETNYQRKKTCWVIWNRMTVFWNGDVPLCCLDTDGNNIIGNLKEQSISDLWNCEQILSLRKIHKEKQFQKYPLCSKCDYS